MNRQNFFLYLFILLFLSGFLQGQIVASATAGCAPFAPTLSGPAGATAVYWTLGGGNQPSTANTVNPPYVNPGTYQITYTAVVGGSNVSYNLQIVVHAPPSGSFGYVLPPGRCKPMVVAFSGSGGSPNSTYSWAFGDLSPMVNGASVSHTYVTKGNFIPIMTIVDAVSGCTAVATSPGTVQVSDPPNLMISSTNGFTGCNPPFTTAISGSNSTTGSPTGGALTYSWNFSTGAPPSATGANPGNVVFPKGNHTITLQGTDNNQCSATIQVQLSVIDPTLSVYVQPTVCLNAKVRATGITSENIIYVKHTVSWGDPSYPVTANTSFTLGGSLGDTLAIFQNPGPNTFTFSVYPGGSCAPIHSVVPVFVEQVVADFTLTPPHSTCSPSMAISYINTSSVNTSHSLTYTWSIDGGNASNHGTPLNVYTTHSTFTVWQGSKNPYTIYRNWIPKIQLVAISNSIAKCRSEIFYEEYDTVRRPTAWFLTDKREGCNPLTVKFSDTSFTMVNGGKNPVYAITGYTLFSGGATTPSVVSGTKVIFPVSFTYTAAGTYTPYMIISTAGGCMDTSFVDTITVVDPPTVNIVSINPTGTVCVGTPVQVHLSASPASSLISHWHVQSDQNFFSGCISDSIVTFPYTHTGTHGFTVSAYQKSCASTSVSSQSITVKGPMGQFRAHTTCDPTTRKTVSFSSFLQEAHTAKLDFGDNSFVTLTGNPSGMASVLSNHTYSAGGNYLVVLTAYNTLSGCGPYTYSTTVTVRELEAGITHNGLPLPALPASIGCPGKALTFSATASTDELAGCKTGYLWLVHTPSMRYIPQVTQLPGMTSPSLQEAGIYTVQLIVKDVNSCSDTTTVRFRISDLAPVFSFSTNPHCMSNGPVKIINNTQAGQVFPDTVTAYEWNFGDGSPLLSSNVYSSSPSHAYLIQPGNTIFSVVVTATNNVGCEGQATRTIQINNPLAALNSTSWTPCLKKGQGSTVVFSAGTGFTSYSISYGDSPGPPAWVISSSFASHPHTYTTPGDYTVRIIVKDNAGCIGSEDRQLIAIGQATPLISFVNNANKWCYPGTPTLVANVTLNGTAITDMLWTIDGVTTAASTQTLTNTFLNGKTIVSLSVDTAGFCRAFDTALVIVSNPIASINVVNKKLCLNDYLYVSLKDTSNVEGWRWFFGDNVPQKDILAQSTAAIFNPTVAYHYTVAPADSMGQVVLNLFYYGLVNSCVRSSSAAVQVIDVHAGFKHRDEIYSHCLGKPDAFLSTYRNPAGHNILYDWNFGDAVNGSGAAVSHTYLAPGTYTVQLFVREKDFGCTDTTTRTITVFPLPSASLGIEPGMVCPEIPFTLSGEGKPGVSGMLTGTLTPAGDSITFLKDNTFTLSAKAAQTTTYALSVTDDNTCESKPAFAVIRVPEPVAEVHWDTTIILGQTVPINAFGGSSYTYSWTPNTTGLSCETCYNPVATSTIPVTYTVEIIDQPLQCYVSKNTYRIMVDPRISLDVPSAFTPNGDGVNDKIYPAGWGIRNLIYFRIYNRWGQLIFESNDLNAGWDGTFQGSPQNMETYVYQVEVESFKEERLYKTGTFKLLR